MLDGELVHQDSEGHNGVIYPGLAQRMSAGTGILHSEKNDAWRLDRRRPSTTTRCTSCRCGCCPTRAASSPATSSSTSPTSSLRGGLVPVASRHGRAHGRGRDLASASGTPRCWPPGWRRAASVAVPDAPFVHVYVAAARSSSRARARWAPATPPGSPAAAASWLTAGPDGAEVLVWEMHAAWH